MGRICPIISGFKWTGSGISLERFLSFSFFLFILPCQSHAVTLDQALAAAYEYNPRIDAERSRLRATDEDVAIAKSGYRPDINAEGSLNSRFSRARTTVGSTITEDFYSNTLRPRTMGISLTQPVFRGFSVLNAVNEAEAGVRAGRENLRGVEQEVLLEAVRNYMDVVRDKAVVRLREGNVKYLSEQLKATQDRFSVGEVTKTDVAQSEARRAGAISDLDLARANLQSSRANYVRTIGASPDNLSEPGVKEGLLPKTVDEAISIATQENPSVVSALYQEQAARFKVDVVRGRLLPQIDFEASYIHNNNASFGVEENEITSLGGRMTLPIYQEGGRFHAEVRKAKQEHLSFLQEIEAARTDVRSKVITAWSVLQASRAQLDSDKAQVAANEIALSGVREEERVGQRTIIETLNAQQELLNSQVNLVNTKRNLIVAAYGLQAAIGRLDALSLNVTNVVYDPQEHYQEVRGKWFGTSITRPDGTQEVVEPPVENSRQGSVK